MADTNKRLALFRDMVQCCHNIYFWDFDSLIELRSSDCPDEIIAMNLFEIDDYAATLRSYVREHSKPTLLSNSYGLIWLAVPETNGELIRSVQVMGPFFSGDINEHTLHSALNQLQFLPSLHRETMRFLKELPIISLSRLFEYAIMLYFCVTGDTITVSDIHYRNALPLNISSASSTTEKTIHGTYEAEQEMLRLVREGDLNYKAHMSKMSVTGTMGTLSNGDPLRQMKNAVLVCVTLFSRAAIEGGVSPETSYTLTDHYFQSVEACPSINELAEISHTMQADFIERVHRCRVSNISKPVQACIDYVALHLAEPISLDELSGQLSYSEHYLSKKFKAEVGQTLKDYLRAQRIERAKHLLRSTQESIQSISERLQFSSQSYFTEVFRKAVGVPPHRMAGILR